MRRALRLHPGQLTLRLTSAPEQPLVTMEEPTILHALADLLNRGARSRPSRPRNRRGNDGERR